MSQRLKAPNTPSFLGRVTAAGRVIPQIDGLRFLAIAGVFLFHIQVYALGKSGGPADTNGFTPILKHLLERGCFGVQLFFVISGALVGLPFIRNAISAGPPVNLLRYARGRFLRLHPPYMLNLLILWAAIGIVEPAKFEALFTNLWSSLCFCTYLLTGQPSKINGVAWSLEVEVQFYLLAPLLAKVFRLQSPAKVGGWLGFGVLLGLILRTTAGFTDKTLLGNLHYFLIGMLLGYFFTLHPIRSSDRKPVWDAMGIAAATTLCALEPDSLLWQWMTPLVAAAICCAALLGKYLGRFLSLPLLVAIGGMSYSFYLYHYAFISFLGRFVLPRMGHLHYPEKILALTLLIAPCALFGAALLFVLFEKPLMGLGRNKPRPRA
jgi:peptidoglycan/LPS O-acetylase OafA/YrhL